MTPAEPLDVAVMAYGVALLIVLPLVDALLHILRTARLRWEEWHDGDQWPSERGWR